jgi:uncharacterized protein (DUF58 family)
MTAPARFQAEALAGRLPPLLLAAERVAATVAQGVHGRRREGMGSSFWQFRPYASGDAATAVDWRQTAKSDRAYVRLNEWDAAQSVWLWADLSPSMDWRSRRELPTKRDRALLLLLATAALLLRGGEQVARLGGERPRSGRAVLDRLALELPKPLAGEKAGLPGPQSLPRNGLLLLAGDFLAPLGDIDRSIGGFAAQGVQGHVLQVLDPAEEGLPFTGRVRFEGLEQDGTMLVSRVESIRERYEERLAAQRAGLAEIVRRFGWSFATHRTDHPATGALLALHAVLGQGRRC